MAWGGSLNKEGSDYIRKLRKADKTIAFLESLKEDLNIKDQQILSRTIKIIIEYVSQISEKEEK